MTREDERKLYEAYNTLDKLLNSSQNKLKLEEVKDIVKEFNNTVTLMLRELPLKPMYMYKATVFFDNFCDDFIKKYKKGEKE